MDVRFAQEYSVEDCLGISKAWSTFSVSVNNKLIIKCGAAQEPRSTLPQLTSRSIRKKIITTWLTCLDG